MHAGASHTPQHPHAMSQSSPSQAALCSGSPTPQDFSALKVGDNVSVRFDVKDKQDGQDYYEWLNGQVRELEGHRQYVLVRFEDKETEWITHAEWEWRYHEPAVTLTIIADA